MKRRIRVQIGETVEYVRVNDSTIITIDDDCVHFSTPGWGGLELDRKPGERVAIHLVPMPY